MLLPVWSNRNIKILLAKKLLNNVGLLHKQDFFPNELSGGEQQRVAIVRALIKKPKIIFADEPTSNLDYKTRAEIEYLLFYLCKNITIVLVTHNTSHLNMFNKIIKMNAGSII
ncbi:MAG: ATP-binding cassette domain-containing protein [Endomicrobium sp.]|nr:ATP-binding cassette domain-containing protein [Endomicrobium sp.]